MKLAIFLLVAAFCFGQATRVQHVAALTAQPAGSPPTTTTSAVDSTGCTPHCLMHVCATSYQYPTISDSAGNTFTQINQTHDNGDIYIREFVAFGPTLSANHTVSVQSSSGVNLGASVEWFKNVASGPDQQNQTAINASSLSSGNVTPTNADELVLGCTAAFGGTDPNVTGSSTLTFGASAHISNGQYVGTTAISISDSYQIQTTATTVQATFTGSGSPAATTVISTYYSTQAPATLTVTTPILPEGFNGVAYGAGSGPGTNQLAASGGIGPYTWALTTGSLTACGLSVSSAGLITGTATTSTCSGLVFTATDTTSTTASSASLTIVVSATALSISSTSPCAAGTQYASYAGCTIISAGGSGSNVFGSLSILGPTALPATCSAFSLIGIEVSSNVVSLYECIAPNTWLLVNAGLSDYATLPEGLSMNTSTGAITGSLITGQGGYGALITVIDSAGAFATKQINFPITGSNAWMQNLFPTGNIFNHRMDAASTGLPVYAGAGISLPSATIHPSFGANPLPQPNGIPAIEVPYNQALVNVTTLQPSGYQPPCYFGASGTGVTSCPGTNLTAPFPAIPIEGSANCQNCDRHGFVYQEAGGGHPPFLWEMWEAIISGSTWTNLGNGLWQTNTLQMTPQDNGTSNAAGTPYTQMLLTYDDFLNGINHIMAFTLANTIHYWMWPGTAQSGNGGSCTGLASGSIIDQSNPPSSCSAQRTAFGAIVRLKASIYNSPPNSCLTNTSTNPQSAAIFKALYQYGMLMIDNGSSGYIIGTPDARWNDTDLTCLTQMNLLSDFEGVNVSSLIVAGNDSMQAGTASPNLSPSSSGAMAAGAGVH